MMMQWFNLIRSFCFGLAGALDTLGSQAFGAGNKVRQHHFFGAFCALY